MEYQNTIHTNKDVFENFRNNNNEENNDNFPNNDALKNDNKNIDHFFEVEHPKKSMSKKDNNEIMSSKWQKIVINSNIKN